MIKLYYMGTLVYINPEKVVAITGGTCTSIYTGENETFGADESPEEVVRKIMEYKLAMVRYMASSQAAYNHHVADGNNPYTPPLDQTFILDKLAGLEDTDA